MKAKNIDQMSLAEVKAASKAAFARIDHLQDRAKEIKLSGMNLTKLYKVGDILIQRKVFGAYQRFYVVVKVTRTELVVDGVGMNVTKRNSGLWVDRNMKVVGDEKVWKKVSQAEFNRKMKVVQTTIDKILEPYGGKK